MVNDEAASGFPVRSSLSILRKSFLFVSRILGERLRDELPACFLGQYFHAPLGLFQLLVATLGKLHPLLVEHQGPIQRKVGILKVTDNRVEARQILFKWLRL